MTKQEINWRMVAVGLVCITALEMVALYKGINGILLTTVIAIIAGAIGVTLPQFKVSK